VSDRPESGVLDTSVYIDLALLDPADLPAVPELTAITFAELHQGVATAKDATIRAARTEKLAAAIVEFEPLSFDGPAAARYGTLVALTIQVNRDPKPRRLDIMIAAVASALGLPLHTRNAKDLGGLADMLDVRQV